VIDRASDLESLTTRRARGEADDFELSRQALFDSLIRPAEPTIPFPALRVRIEDNDPQSLVCPSANVIEGQRHLADVAFPIGERDDHDALRGKIAYLSPTRENAGFVRQIPKESMLVKLEERQAVERQQISPDFGPR
jgi:hypothetical protein